MLFPCKTCITLSICVSKIQPRFEKFKTQDYVKGTKFQDIMISRLRSRCNIFKAYFPFPYKYDSTPYWLIYKHQIKRYHMIVDFFKLRRFK